TAAGKTIVMLHPGRSNAARASAQSHTGALAGDHAVMRTLATRHGILLAGGLDELIDVSELLVRFAKAPSAGAARPPHSGAFKGMTLDFCDELGLDLPALPPATAEMLARELPEFVGPSNPLDITAQGILDLDLYARTLRPLIADDTYGSVLAAAIVSSN